jgi:PKD repeat protein
MTHTFDEEGEYDVYLKVDDGSAIDTVTKSVTVQEETDEQTTDDGTNETDTEDDTEDSEEGSTGGEGDGSGERDSGESSGFDLPSEAPEVGDELALEAGDVGLEGNITEYEWRVDGEVVGTGEDVSHILESSGDVNVTLSVSDDAGGNATFTRTVSVEEVQQEMEEREEQTEGDQMGENETEDETEEQAENETDEQDGEGLPGFTAISALLAALVVIARRRA